MDSANDYVISLCGLCQEECSVENIETHPCMQGYAAIVLSDTNQFYPKTVDGQIITNINESAGDIDQMDKENVNRSNDCTAIIASMEEILISAVQDRPPLWNFKDTLPSQRTKAAKDQLWQDIANLMNTNKENKQYTANALKMEWKNLYDTYRVNIIKEKGKSGQAAKKCKPWRYMKQMSFLKDSFDLGIKNTVSNLTIPKEKDTNLPDDTEELDDLNRSSDDFEFNKGKKRKLNDDPIQIIANALSQPIPPPQIVQPPLLPMPEIKEGDEISHFCSTIDKKLRYFNKKEANRAMFKIYELLFKLENELDVE